MTWHWRQHHSVQGHHLFISFILFLLTALLPVQLSLADVPVQQNELLQFTANGHVLGFQPDGVYIAGGNHVLRVGFVDTQGVKPIADSVAIGDNRALPLNKVTYPALWSGIDLVYEAAGGDIVESTWTIAPGADPEQIRLTYNAPVVIEKDGSLRISCQTGWMRESKPVAWQEINGNRVPIQVAFNKTGKMDESGFIGFALGQYDSSYPLLIDPIMEWNTFMGSSAYDEGRGIAVDADGNIYVVGTSHTTWGTPRNGFGGGSDAFIVKLNSAGVLQWNSFIGSTGDETGDDIAVDANAVYITGISTTTGGGDAFAAMVNKEGYFQWYTAVGHSTAYDRGYGIAVDTSANVYVTGYSNYNWNSPGGTPPVVANAGLDAFVVKLNYAGVYEWHTFLGGAAGTEQGRAVATDNSGYVYVAGNSGANWGAPLVGHAGGFDVFAAKLSAANGTREWNTFMGSTSSDYGRGIAVDSSGNAYISGFSQSGWGTRALNHNGGNDAFAAKLTTGGVMLWNQFLGSAARDEAHGIVVNDGGEIFLVGQSDASWGAPFDPYAAGSDAFAAKLDGGGALLWNAFFGGASPLYFNHDRGYGIDLDASGKVYVAGDSDRNWGTPVVPGNNDDVFVVKVCTDCYAVSTSAPAGQGSFSPTSSIVQNGDTTSFTVTAEPGYLIADVSGCGGTWTGTNPYVTGAVTADCTVTASFNRNPIVTPSPGSFSSLLSAGDSHALAVKGDGAPEVWGCNSFEQTDMPAGLTGVTAVDAGQYHSLVLHSNGTVTAWGSNYSGESTVPGTLSNVVAVAAGYGKSFALKSDGTMVGWGGGNAATIAAGKTDIIAVSSGNFTLALKGDSTVIHLGTPSPGNGVPAGLTNVIDISVGYHALALKGDGTVVAWGNNTNGEATVPAGLAGVVAVSAGNGHSLALKSDGTVVAWGSDSQNQSTVPAGLTGVVAVSAAPLYSLALKSDGTVVRWGYYNLCTQLPTPPLGLLPFHGERGSILPAMPQSITYGSTVQFSVAPDAGYSASVGGTCGGALVGNTYTTNAITIDCTVDASFSINSYTVTASVDGNGTLDSTSAVVDYGSTASFTVTPDAGYTTDTTVGGTCPAGLWNGSIYSTGAITETCSVSFTHTAIYTVSASVDAHGTLDSNEETVIHGSTASFTVTPEIGYSTDAAVGGNCPAGSWSDQTYTTGEVTAACSINFTHTQDITVNASVDTHGTLNHNIVTVTPGSVANFTVTPDTGYTTDNAVGGTCPTGSWSDSTYSTGVIVATCSVSFTHTPASYTVSASVDAHGALDSNEEIVTHDSTASFTVTPDTGYTTSPAVGGTCPTGSWSGQTYTTGAITGSCSVSFTTTPILYSVSAYVDAHGTVDDNHEMIAHGSTASFTVTPDAGYTTDSAVGGSCPAGSWSGSTYTTGIITSQCYARFTHSLTFFTVTPTPSSPFLLISGGDAHSLALQSDRTVAAWGDDSAGQTTIPAGLTDAIAVAAGGYHSLALKGDGTVVAWGHNNNGQTTVPEELTDVVAIAAGLRHSLALNSDGTVLGWGDTRYDYDTPPAGLSNVIAVADGQTHSLALKNDGTVVGWGYSLYGEVYPPSGLSGVVAIAAGQNHSLALKDDGTVVAWGRDSHGQSTVPTGLTDVIGIAAGGYHSLALRNDGTVIGWGYDGHGQITIPAEAVDVVAVAAGGHHTLALKGDGSIVAWGWNDFNQVDIPAGLNLLPFHGEHGTIFPDTPQGVIPGSTMEFTLIPDAGYTATVAGTCGGTLAGNTYTTNAIMVDCSVEATFVLVGHTVTPSAGDNGAIAPDTPQGVSTGATIQFTVTPDAGYTASVGGTCGGTLVGDTYTTNAITADCTVDATFFTLINYTVNASVDTHGSLNSTSQMINHGSTADFTVTPETGYTTDTTVGGTCPAGSWSGQTYTTGPIVGACNISFTHTLKSYTVTPSAGANGTILPDTSQAVTHGSTTQFTLTSDTDYIATVGGSCGGTLVGNTYTTNAITGDCAVEATFIQGHTVTPSAGANGTIAPDTLQGVPLGTTIQFTLTPDTGYIATVGGSCGGTLVGNTYTTNAITGDCAVEVTFIQGHTVTPSAGANGTIAPDTLQGVPLGTTTQFTITPDTGYTASVGGTCGGTLAGDTYTTSAIVSDCTVDATFTLNSYMVSTSALAEQGSFTPESQTVNHGDTTAFEVHAEEGFTIQTVTGCGGTWTGINPYVTGPINVDCTVEATFSSTDECNFFSIPAKDGKTITICL